MVVLALETITRAGSVAVLVGDTCHAGAGDPQRTHAGRLPGELLAWLERFGLSLKDVDCFAIISGPGSFTGLRVGMAAVQGLTISTSRPIVAVPTLNAMAIGYITHKQPAPGTIVVPCLDGHRQEVFSAAWRVAAAADLTSPLIEPRVGAADALARDLAALDREAPVVVVGDGARRYAAVLGDDFMIDDVPVTLAEVAARYAREHVHAAVKPHALRPVYIRRPDAVLARERASEAARQA